MEIIIANQFRLGQKIGTGAFGDIYSGKALETDNDIAIKLEQHNKNQSLLLYEANIYKILQGGRGIPRMHWAGQEGEFNVMILDLLGPSLEELFKFCNHQFTVNTVSLIAIQVIQRIEYLHAKCLIHRDIKPENFLIGIYQQISTIYMIDLGLAKKYCDPRSGKHIEAQTGKNITGTIRYSSIYTHLGFEQSRRTDLESTAYMLIYFLKGKLPWQNINFENEEDKCEQILEIKQQINSKKLCEGLPSQYYFKIEQFEQFLEYSKKLSFDEKPDYQWLIQQFKQLVDHYDYDWIIKRKN